MINNLYPSEITCVVVNEKEERPPPLSDWQYILDYLEHGWYSS
jgi:hypothetical protein